MTRVVVTGAAGYIGRHVVSSLLDAGADVVAIDRGTRPDRRIDPRAEIIVTDILDGVPGVYDRLGRPDVCVHLAWDSGFDHGSPNHMGRLSGHYRLLTDLIDEGLPQLAVLGTMHEVGFFEGEIDGDTPANPQSLYGVAKNALRESLQLYTAGLETRLQWLRCFYVYGDDEHSQSVFNKIRSAAARGETTFNMTLARSKYDFIEVRELARQIALAALQTEVLGVISCGSGLAVELRERIDKYVADEGLLITPVYGAFPERRYDSPATWANLDKMNMILAAAARAD